MKAALATRLAKASKNKKPKVKSFDVSNDDDGPPWDEDIKSSPIPTKAAVKKATKAARELGVRDYGSTEEEDVESDVARAKFAKRMKRIAKKVADNQAVYNSPATQESVTRLALAAVIRQIPEAEKAYNSTHSERAAYAHIAYNNQARELMNDLRNMSSTDALADRVVAEAVTPAFLQLVNFVIVEAGTIRAKLNGASSPEAMARAINEQLDNVLNSIGEFGQETLDKANENARRCLKG